MKLISWNVWGLGQSWSVGHLRQKLRDENPCMFFLIETKLQSFKMARVRNKCGYPNGIDVSSNERSGGLSFGWRNSCAISLRLYSDRHIDIMIDDNSTGKK
ncbi:hypothetical protein HRI_002628200 [Hibiscus trionum]|uniref:Endonuclease/exonuclease/phosphatase domain-containing protein n=1 Tax=Hibiscus trionum TaxID=183268 RepID=A0A9W7I582_HIBTR|nr:hypothetical protein HRI_002628200 [Hibiscus trionum]